MTDRDERGRLDDFLLGGPPVYTLAEASERTGIPERVVRRLWRSLGLALPAADEPAFNDGDLAAMRTMQTGSRSGVLDVDTEVRLARAVGQTMARLADWQASTLLSALDDPAPAPRPGDPARPDAPAEPGDPARHGDPAQPGDTAPGTAGPDRPISLAEALADRLGDAYEDLLVFAWKRHLSAAVERAEAAGEMGEESHAVVNTVGFADLVQFSALSNELDEDRISDLVEIFEIRASDVVTSRGGRVIKTLGDSVLFVTEEPVAGMEIAHGIIDVIGDDPRLPDVRLGLATGSVILRFGDVFGPPVNLAARLTAIARRNRVITDRATAGQLPQTAYETRALTARPVRGFGVLEPIAVRRLEARAALRGSVPGRRA